MNLLGIVFHFLAVSSFGDRAFSAEIPFTGDDHILLQTELGSFESTVKKYQLSQETVDQFKSLIDKYNILEWIGKPVMPPEIVDGTNAAVCSLTLRFDDETSADITFRETDKETGEAAAKAFRTLFFDSRKDESLISEEEIYPTIKDCREMKETHGPVVAVETNAFSMGMMYGSNQTTIRTIEKIPDKEGMVLVTVKKQAGNKPEVSESKECASDVLEKIREVSEKENLPCWHYVRRDPSKPDCRPVIMDYSSSYSISLFYDDSLITGNPKTKRTLEDNISYLGGEEAVKALRELVSNCVATAGISLEMPQMNLFDQTNGMPLAMAEPAPDFQKMFPGMIQPSQATTAEWTCKGCGKTGLTSKFCPECGYPAE